MKQLRLSGSGGQGVITAAIIFAEAAIAEGLVAIEVSASIGFVFGSHIDSRAEGAES